MVNLKSHFVGFFLYYYSMANRIIEQENKMIDEIIENFIFHQVVDLKVMLGLIDMDILKL